MTFEPNPTTTARVAALPAVRQAALAGARLVALWPLTDATRMDNDEKYAEDLQVRLTRAFAQVMTGQEVTMPDAEFVYEGAETIPGRPQAIVDALLAANDAYDAMADFSDTGEAGLVEDAARTLGVSWGSATEAAVREVLAAVAHMTPEEADTDGGATAAADAAPAPAAGDAADAEPTEGNVEALAARFATALVVCDALLAASADKARATGEAGDAAARAALPVVLMVNELRERIAVPRLFLSADDLRALMARRVEAGDDAAARLDATVALVAPLAEAEWTKHRDAVLWDPEEAKRRAKEEDEAKSKAALAAKFAHVKDDPSKPHVEL